MQNQLALIGCLDSGLRELRLSDIAHLTTEQAAFRFCIQCSRVHHTQEDLADMMETSKGELNCMLNADSNKRPKYMSRTRQIKLQRICGNTAIDQWAELYANNLLICQREAVQEALQLNTK